jgi:glycosyltransferase involved in cell wall biosynthesis
MSGHPEARAVLVIPAHNEEPVIARTIDSLPPHFFEWVMVADNGSTDRTAEEARKAGAGVVQIAEKGYGAACLAALAALPAEAKYVVFLQADGSEDASEAGHLLAPLLDGRADLVVGSRTLGRSEEGSLLPHQRFGNWLATRLIRWIYGHAYTDLGPFRALGTETLRQMNMRDRNYGWTVEMQVRALEQGLRVLEVPVSYRKRQAGVNKVSGNLRASLMAGWKILWTVARVRLERRGVHSSEEPRRRERVR